MKNNVVNFREKKKQCKVATKVKVTFDYAQTQAASLTDEEYREYIMLLYADLTVFIARSGFYSDPEKTLTDGVRKLIKRYS